MSYLCVSCSGCPCFTSAQTLNTPHPTLPPSTPSHPAEVLVQEGGHQGHVPGGEEQALPIRGFSPATVARCKHGPLHGHRSPFGYRPLIWGAVYRESNHMIICSLCKDDAHSRYTYLPCVSIKPQLPNMSASNIRLSVNTLWNVFLLRIAGPVKSGSQACTMVEPH